MNEKVAEMGNQVSQAFAKLRDNWKNQDAGRRKNILVVAVVLVVAALVATLLLNLLGGRYVVLYADMSLDESTRALGVLQQANIPARINQSTGKLEVPSNRENEAMGQLATQGIPSSTLIYDIFSQAGGLTTTDFEKKEYQIYQTQNRLQDIIKTYNGVQNAYVTLNINRDSVRAWDAGSTKNSASVKVDLEPGVSLTPSQVSGIQYYVGSSTGIDPNEVTVLDSAGNLLAAAGNSQNGALLEGQQLLERIGLETEIEKSYIQKVANILSLPYPDSDAYRIGVTLEFDYDAIIREIMEYQPLEGTDGGVTQHESVQAGMGVGQYEGVVGEENNTDVPQYIDLDGDGELDMVDYYRERDFLVSYVKEQIEKDGAKLVDASIAILIQGTLSNEERQALRESIAAATNRPIEDISVQTMMDTGAPQLPGQADSDTIAGLPAIFIYIAAGVAVLLVLVLVLILLLRGRAKKKRMAAELAAAAAEQEEAERVQREIEERKKQLKDAASGNESDNAITNEVRDFAKTNPEITANLLRSWLKEGEG